MLMHTLNVLALLTLGQAPLQQADLTAQVAVALALASKNKMSDVEVVKPERPVHPARPGIVSRLLAARQALRCQECSPVCECGCQVGMPCLCRRQPWRGHSAIYPGLFPGPRMVPLIGATFPSFSSVRGGGGC